MQVMMLASGAVCLASSGGTWTQDTITSSGRSSFECKKGTQIWYK